MKATFFTALPPRWRKLLLWMAGVVLAYTLVGFLILPPIIRAIAVKQLAKNFNRPASIQKIRLNPYALSVTIRGLAIKDKDGEDFVKWDEVYVNLQLASFFIHPWVFKEIHISQPFVRAQVNKDSTLNFSDLVEKFSNQSKGVAASKPAKPVAVRVELLHIMGARASLADLSPRKPFRRTIGPFEITLKKFYTDPNNKNSYAFAGTTDSGERYTWNGYFYLDPIRSQGDFTLEGVSLKKYAPLYQDLVRFDIPDGVIDIRSTYQVEKRAAATLVTITNTTLRLKSLKVAEKGGESVLELGEFALVGVSADLAARRSEVASIGINDGRFVVRRAHDESVNVLELAKPAETATNAPGGVLLLLQSVTNAFATLLRSTNMWTAALHDLSVTNCALRLEDLAHTRPARLTIDQITLAAKDLSNIPGTNMTAALGLRWDTNGSLRMQAEAALSPPQANVKLALDNINFRPLDPYLEQRVKAFIRRSKLGLDGTINMRRTNDELPEVTFQGNARLDDFSTVDEVMSEDLLKWGSLRVGGISANLNPASVSVKEIALNDVYVRLVIETNRSFNLVNALHSGETNATVSGDSTPQKPDKTERDKSARAVEAKTGPTNGTAVASLPVRMSVEAIALTNAQLDFIDRSLQPPVSFSIRELGASVSRISSDDSQRADVNLHAKVDRTGVLEIGSKLNPLNQSQPIELKVAFKDVDLRAAGPYSAKFIGYRLNKGKLNLDLAYTIAERKLKAENIIVLDQLTLGEQVESTNAAKLPIKLAIAVMKDREGKIQLKVPVDGSLDDPEFHLGPVINQALLKIITKIVTSPFAALGAIFGGSGEEISFQEFDPGASELLPASAGKLDSLVKGLYERPGLQLEIEGSVDSATDLAALRRKKLDKELRAAKWRALDKDEQTRTKPDELPFTPEERANYIKTKYTVEFSSGRATATNSTTSTAGGSSTNRAVKLPASVLLAKPSGIEKGANALLTQSASEESKLPMTDMEAQLLERIEVTPRDFEAIATERAQRVKEYILHSGKVEAERVSLTQFGTQGVNTKGSRVYLHLQ